LTCEFSSNLLIFKNDPLYAVLFLKDVLFITKFDELDPSEISIGKIPSLKLQFVISELDKFIDDSLAKNPISFIL